MHVLHRSSAIYKLSLPLHLWSEDTASSGNPTKDRSGDERLMRYTAHFHVNYRAFQLRSSRGALICASTVVFATCVRVGVIEGGVFP